MARALPPGCWEVAEESGLESGAGLCGAAATEALAHLWGPERVAPQSLGPELFSLSLATGCPCRLAVFGPIGLFISLRSPEGLGGKLLAYCTRAAGE